MDSPDPSFSPSQYGPIAELSCEQGMLGQAQGKAISLTLFVKVLLSPGCDEKLDRLDVATVEHVLYLFFSFVVKEQHTSYGSL